MDMAPEVDTEVVDTWRGGRRGVVDVVGGCEVWFFVGAGRLLCVAGCLWGDDDDDAIFFLCKSTGGVASSRFVADDDGDVIVLVVVVVFVSAGSPFGSLEMTLFFLRTTRRTSF